MSLFFRELFRSKVRTLLFLSSCAYSGACERIERGKKSSLIQKYIEFIGGLEGSNHKFKQKGNKQEQPRTLRDYTIPLVDEIHTSIRRLVIQDNNFEIKPSVIQMIQFEGLSNDDPKTHVKRFWRYAIHPNKLVLLTMSLDLIFSFLT